MRLEYIVDSGSGPLTIDSVTASRDGSNIDVLVRVTAGDFSALDSKVGGGLTGPFPRGDYTVRLFLSSASYYHGYSPPQLEATQPLHVSSAPATPVPVSRGALLILAALVLVGPVFAHGHNGKAA